LIGATATRFAEAYLTGPITEPITGPITDATYPPRQLTNAGAAIEGWQLGTVETIRWRSKDGTEIEGVLRKPANFDPSKQYPLLFVVHGGPRGVSLETLLSRPDMMYYPAVQFANAEMLVLSPNYRGSTGRGQAFTELNVNNLGIGDLWDLESAIDHLATLGWVDERRVGCMGWSQGGYISAFAGLHSERFAAVSVGAGISDWYTYHISNDIPYFTTDYLSGSPFHNRTFYAPTAPMSNLANAKTPMLIQHGSDDRRVPLSNALELYRGLQAMGVPVELFVYPGMGHPITKPRENHAVMCQNWDWFAKYLLGG
jgi:dipeptidyl aminopeptidase/acylaminoacyl peptidase